MVHLVPLKSFNGVMCNGFCVVMRSKPIHLNLVLNTDGEDNTS